MAVTSPDELPYPTDYSDPADVPAALEALAVAVQAALIPVGTVVPYMGPVAPAGWHMCDGTAHGSEALAAVIGPNTPDLRGRFLTGAGGSYALGAVGGAAEVTLTAAQSGLRDHGHTTAGASADHSHSVTVSGGGHGHGQAYQQNYLDQVDSAGTGAWTTTQNPYSGATSTDGSHSHSGQTGGHSADHAHGVNGSGAWDAAAAHENRPPYYAINYIIRKGP